MGATKKMMQSIMKPKYGGPERRENGSTDDLPTWANLIVGIIYKFGVPAAIAIFLVYAGAKELPAVRDRLTATNQKLDIQSSTLSEMKDKNDAIFRMMQRICSNTAKTDSDRNRCFDK